MAGDLLGAAAVGGVSWITCKPGAGDAFAAEVSMAWAAATAWRWAT